MVGKGIEEEEERGTIVEKGKKSTFFPLFKVEVHDSSFLY